MLKRRGQVSWLMTVLLAWPEPIAAAPPTGTSGVAELHGQAMGAVKRGDKAMAAGLFAAAYAEHEDPCSAQALILLLDAHGAYVATYDREADAAYLCQDEALLTRALSENCRANRIEVEDALLEIRRRQRRDETVCRTAKPLSRLLDDDIPAAVPVPDPSPTTVVAPPPGTIPVAGAPRAADRGLVIGGKTLLATSGVAVVAGIVAGALGEQAERRIESQLRAQSAGCQPGALSGVCEQLDRRGETLNRIAIVSGVLAGALIVSGIALLIAARSGRHRGSLRAAGGAAGWGWRF